MHAARAIWRDTLRVHAVAILPARSRHRTDHQPDDERASAASLLGTRTYTRPHVMPRRWKPLKQALSLVAFLVAALGGSSRATAAPPTPPTQRVLVASIDGMIDLGQGPFVERVLNEAERSNARWVVLEVNTFGGRVDAAVLIRDHLMRSRVPTVAFVNPRAISAGALISLAAEKIVIAPGGTIGAATPVQMGGPGEGSSPTDEKTVSYVRKEFRATADARGRPGKIAEAMVDPDVEIEGLIDKGKLLTLTTRDALQHGVADAEASDIPGLLRELGVANAEVERVSENWAERLLRFLTHPAISSLLMTLALLGVVVELRSPGFGIPGLVGLSCLALFFWGHWLVRLVGWEQVLLIGVDLALLALEVFVIPGFGVAGILGILALGAGLSSSLFGAGASLREVGTAVVRVVISSALAVTGSLLVLRFLPALPGGRRLVLGATLSERGPEALGRMSLMGVTGVCITPLRPAGIATLNDRRVDVVSEGGFVESGERVVVVRDEGIRVVVRRDQPLPPTGGRTQ